MVRSQKGRRGKTPEVGTTLGSFTHAHRTGAGALGAGTRPAFVEFEPGKVLRLYQTAHSESTVDKWELCPVAAGKVKANRHAGSTLFFRTPLFSRHVGRTRWQPGLIHGGLKEPTRQLAR
jgi:hypothetical protein